MDIINITNITNIRNKLINYNKCICKHLKKTASINKQKKVYIQEINIIDEFNIHNEFNNLLLTMIDEHNNLMHKFIELYNKFIDLLEYISQSTPEIFNESMNINSIKSVNSIKIKNKKKLDLETFDRLIIYSLSEKDKHLLYNYLITRKTDVTIKIEKIISLIEKLKIITNDFKTNLLNPKTYNQ